MKDDEGRITTLVNIDILNGIKIRAALDNRKLRYIIEEALTEWSARNPVDEGEIERAIDG